MHARFSFRAALIAATAVVTPASAGGGHGGAMFHPGGGFHGGGMRFGGGTSQMAGGGFRGGMRGMPPIAGVIHERSGVRPFVSAYGHTNTASGLGRFAGPIRPPGHTGLGYRPGFAGGWQAPYGHTATGYRPTFAGGSRVGRGYRFGDARRRFGETRLIAGRGGFYGGDGSGWPGSYGEDLGSYGGQGVYGGQGSYGGQGAYGGLGTYGGGAADQGASYVSETPLAARFAEPALAPSPYGGADSYAYAASEDVGYGVGPRVLTVDHGAPAPCTCDSRPRTSPVVYRYGVGTAY